MTQAPDRWHWGEPLAPLRQLLSAEGLVAIPTESSYGLGVDPRSEPGVNAVYRFKGRPRERPLPVVLGDLEQLGLLGGDPASPALRRLARLWPAPLTVVVPIVRPVPASAGTNSLAVRIPAHTRLRELLRALGIPLTATSANPSGGSPVCSPDALARLLGGWPSVIIDDGQLPGGAPSTIVELVDDGVSVLRPGALSVERLRQLLDTPVFSAATAEIPVDGWRPKR